MVIEARIIQYLSQELEGVGVYGEVPKDLPEKFVIVSKSGGSRSNRVSKAFITVLSYDTTMAKAATLSENVVNTLLEMPGSSANVSSVRLNSETNYTDTTRRQPRYQAVFEVVYF